MTSTLLNCSGVTHLERIKEDKFIELANELFTKGKKQELYFVSIGCFQKSTLYLLPVYNEFFIPQNV